MYGKIAFVNCSSTVLTKKGIKINSSIEPGDCFRIGEVVYLIVYVYDDTVICTPMNVTVDELQKLKFEMCATSDPDDPLSCTNVEQVCNAFVERHLTNSNLVIANSKTAVCATLMDNIAQYTDADDVLEKMEDISGTFAAMTLNDKEQFTSSKIIDSVTGVVYSEADECYYIDVITKGCIPAASAVRKRFRVDPAMDEKTPDVYIRPYVMLPKDLFVNDERVGATFSSVFIGQKSFSIGDALWLPWDSRRELFSFTPAFDAISMRKSGISALKPKRAYIGGINFKLNSITHGSVEMCNYSLVLNWDGALGLKSTVINVDNPKLEYMAAFHNKQDCEEYCDTIAETAKVKRKDLELLDKDALIWIASHPECIED